MMHWKKGKRVFCYYCNGNHYSRACPIEKKKSTKLKKKVGKYMEGYYSRNYSCIRCGCENLIVKGDRSPSWDLTCLQCGNILEIKSKCLSAKKIPQYIVLHHGSFKHYEKRQENGLDFVVIIYRVNRSSKEVFIREIMYFRNEQIKNKDIFVVKPNDNSQLSKIYINNREDPRIIKLNLPDQSKINFTEQVNNIEISV